MKRKRFLLLDGRSGRYWLRKLDHVVKILSGELIVKSAEQKDKLDWHNYDFVILDAGTIDNISETLEEIRSKNKAIKAIVVSSAPMWDDAREAILAGAVDYLRKESDIMYLKQALTKILQIVDPKNNTVGGH